MTWKAKIQGGSRWCVDNGRDIIAMGLIKDDAHLIAAALNEASGETAKQRNELLAALEEAPIISKYHGHKGFEVNRFLEDYQIWASKARAAIKSADTGDRG